MFVVTAVEKLTRALQRVPGVCLAVLFGSAARGTTHSRSDIDLGVLLEPGIDVSPAMHVALEREAGRQVGLTRLDEAPPLLRFEIARDGVVLIARDQDAWPEFRAHAMIDWWDWAPTARMMHRTMRERLREEAGHGPS